MRTTRREFLGLLGGVALVGGLVVVGRSGPAGQTGALLRSRAPLRPMFSAPLPIPAVAGPRRLDGVDRYELTQRPHEVRILADRTTEIWGYDGTFPGPTIRAQAGRPVELLVRNDLPIPTVTHLHGGRTPPDSDGYPTDLILPSDDRNVDRPMMRDVTDGERLYRYPLQQRPASLWYHDHAMDFTGPNVYRGLAGFFILEDDLPLPRGDQDLPLMVCDRAFDADGRFLYPALSPGQERPGVQDRYLGGVLGDVILVNGTPWPRHQVPRTRHRLRLLNASNARRYQLVLEPPPPDGSPFTQVGSDAGLLGSPVSQTSITLAPAERADVVVDFSAYPAGTEVVLRNRLGTGPTSNVMRFDVGGSAADRSEIPEQLSEWEHLERRDAARTRTFHFQLGHDSQASRDDADQEGRGHHRWTVNGRPFDPEQDQAQPRLGDVEVWRFTTDVHHPIHLHLAHFQVLARNGGSPGHADVGWKDTLDLLPGSTAEVIARFDGYRGRYVFHCHNLEHEDMAMMANFSVR